MAHQVMPAVRTTLPTATVGETLRVIGQVFLPTFAKGVIIRRPPVVAMAERLDLDRRAVRVVQRLRDRYGDGPLMLRLPFRSQAIILAPEHVHRVLHESPEPFATASSEKRAALGHFQPQGVLISHGAERADRRRFNEGVLDTPRPVHHLAERFVPVVREEAELLIGAVRHRGELIWEDFARTWFRVVRRVTLGDGARDDEELTGMLARLRSDANWAFLKPRRRGLRHAFYERLQGHLDRAEPGSLASVMAHTPKTSATAPSNQVPQWLFAFDPAGMATFRALALLAAHPTHAAQANAEIQRRSPEREELRFLRACVLDALRLYPTTPMVLRQTTRATEWEHGVMPAKTGVLIFAPFFHRDDRRLPFADRFAPELWMENQLARGWPLIPFSGGPAICPGQNLVLLLSSTMLATLLDRRQVALRQPGRLDQRRPLPGTLDHYSLRLTLAG